MTMIAAQRCPVCTTRIEMHTRPRAWLHVERPCTSPSYTELCNPAGALNLNPDRADERAILAEHGRRELATSRVRSAPGRTTSTFVQKMRDHDSAQPRPPRTP